MNPKDQLAAVRSEVLKLKAQVEQGRVVGLEDQLQALADSCMPPESPKVAPVEFDRPRAHELEEIEPVKRKR
jgi:hypothetical protein